MICTNSKKGRQKLDEISEKCIFIGYSLMSKSYKLYNLKNGKILISRDVAVDEKSTWNWEKKKIKRNVVVPEKTAS